MIPFTKIWFYKVKSWYWSCRCLLQSVDRNVEISGRIGYPPPPPPIFCCLLKKRSKEEETGKDQSLCLLLNSSGREAKNSCLVAKKEEMENFLDNPTENNFKQEEMDKMTESMGAIQWWWKRRIVDYFYNYKLDR